jgi:L-amino acid N-acyltransferase YncA
MKVEFRKAVQPRETRALLAFDRRVFPVSDRFDADYWRCCEAWWMFVDRVKAGCCAFEENYIATTGILPGYQGKGLGSLMKAWQIAYAKKRGYSCLIANARKSNAASIALNRKFGFRITKTVPDYYEEPNEPGVVMRLDLNPVDVRTTTRKPRRRSGTGSESAE